MLKLVLSSSMDAMLEATRVYGNVSQSKAVRDFIMQNKGIWWKQTPTDTHKTLPRETLLLYFLFKPYFIESCRKDMPFENKPTSLKPSNTEKKRPMDAEITSSMHRTLHNTEYLDSVLSTVGSSAYCCVMFRLDLSARPASVSVNTPADSGDSSLLIFDLLCLRRALTSSSLSTLLPPSFSAPVCSDAARLKKHWDVFCSLRGPHQPDAGPPQQAQSHSGGGWCQVRTYALRKDPYSTYFIWQTLPGLLTRYSKRRSTLHNT